VRTFSKEEKPVFHLGDFYMESRGHGSLTPSHANEAMEFRPEENVDAHSCTCYFIVVDMVILLKHWS